ncbi:DUF3846 domain-containing protein [Streptomyces tauricus]|uniref:DUF3846 domain-containing protein n=1 Tax=Streptomyces tauricus TaxID=68274 RepID=UPI0022443CBC|nr:DUF3846 domain-containing protein [Streptomyces tauricus]MCW8103543.1 DUF3846 domain-containing protein [Streptomyces tauricus]
MTKPASALLLTCNTHLVEIDLPFGTDSSAERRAVLRAVLRCDYFDVVALTHRWDMWIDDEGQSRHPVNPAATALAQRFGFTHQRYHGPVLFTGGPDEEGNTLPLLREQLTGLLLTLQDL